MRICYYNTAIKRFINQDVETGSMDNSASLNRYAYVQGNPVSLTDPFGLSPDMEYGNYEANALKRLFKIADKVADYLPVVGTARDMKRSYNAFKNGNIADGIKHGATAALALAGPTAKVMKSAMKLAKNSLKAEKCLSKIAQIASEGIKLAGKAVRRVGDAGKKVGKTVKNGVSAVARTVKRNAVKIFKGEGSRNAGGNSKKILNVGAGDSPIPGAINIDIEPRVPGVIFGDVNDLWQFDSGYFDHIIALNPYKYNLLNSDVPRVLKNGGMMSVTGNYSNKYFKRIYNASPEVLNQAGFEILFRGDATDILKKYGGKVSDGSRRTKGKVLQIILKKVGRK